MTTDHDRQFLVYEIEDILIAKIDLEAMLEALSNIERPTYCH